MQTNVRSSLEDDQMPYDNMFVWNAFLTSGIRKTLQNTWWTLALVHGFFRQEKLSIFGRNFVISLIGRRSRHFAGTRYLKRGVNDKGRVANDIETEQLVMNEESGIGPGTGQVSSVVQHRGSIPLFGPKKVHVSVPSLTSYISTGCYKDITQRLVFYEDKEINDLTYGW